MKIKAIVYAILALGSASYRYHLGDAEGFYLSLFVLPACFLLFNQKEVK